MRWDSIHLGEVMHVKHGYAFKSEGFADSRQLILLTPGNCYENGGLKLKGDREKYYVGEFPPEFLLHEGDMLVVMTDLINTAPILGGSFFISEDNKFLHNQRLGLVQITNEKRIDKTFLYYLLNTRDYRGQIRGSASGATVRHTSPSRIQACEVRIPSDVSYQRQLVSIPQAYDELIENNRRRIALLEQAAHELYREWFVRLRFPGYEHTEINNGVPHAWERAALETALTLQRGFDLPVQDREAGDIPVYGSTGITAFHSRAKVPGPGVVTGRSGTLGQVEYVADDFWPLNTSLWVTEFKRVSPLFAVFLLREMNLKQYNGGVSVPTLDRKIVHKALILLPTRVLLNAFDEITQPSFAQIDVLKRQTQQLRAARDLLLPRLMSGQIAV